MNYNLLLNVASLLGASLLSFGQVGINTDNPHSSFHVKKNFKSDNKMADGILIPRLTKNELSNKDINTYTENQIGTLIYVSDISDGNSGTSLSQVSNINKEGFYYFSENKEWVSLIPNYIEHANKNIYTGDGALISNRTVDQNGNKKFFESNIENGFSIGNDQSSPQLSIDTKNNRVGFGTDTPSVVVETKSFRLADGNEGEGKVLTNIDYLGNGTWKTIEYPSLVEGIIFPTSTVTSFSFQSYIKIPSSITLPKGKWLVHVGFMTEVTFVPSITNSIWVQTMLVTTQGANGTELGEPGTVSNIGNYLTTNKVVSGWTSPSIFNGKGYSFISGVVPIEITSSTPVELMMRMRNFATANGTTGKIIKSGENYFYATQIR